LCDGLSVLRKSNSEKMVMGQWSLEIQREVHVHSHETDIGTTGSMLAWAAFCLSHNGSSFSNFNIVDMMTCLTGEGCDLHRLISLMFRPSACQLSAVVPFLLLVLRSGTAYQTMSPPLLSCQPSGAI